MNMWLIGAKTHIDMLWLEQRVTRTNVSFWLIFNQWYSFAKMRYYAKHSNCFAVTITGAIQLNLYCLHPSFQERKISLIFHKKCHVLSCLSIRIYRITYYDILKWVCASESMYLYLKFDSASAMISLVLGSTYHLCNNNNNVWRGVCDM